MRQQSITPGEAMRVLGVSPAKLRRMLQAGVIKKHGRSTTGELLLAADSVAVVLAAKHLRVSQSTTVRNEKHTSFMPTAEGLAALVESIQHVEQNIAKLTTELGQAATELDLLMTHVGLVQKRMDKLEQELQAARTELEIAGSLLTLYQQEHDAPVMAEDFDRQVALSELKLREEDDEDA